MNKTFGLFASSLVATLVATSASAESQKGKKSDTKGGKAAADVCINNACKGNSECKGHGNDGCKGQNSCKGHGWIKADTKEACEAEGKGKWMAGKK